MKPNEDDQAPVIAELSEHYTRLFKQYGDSPCSVQLRDRETQYQRFRILTDVGDLGGAKILDFGCGIGHLLEFLRGEGNFAGEYVGLDIVHEFVEFARGKFPGVRFETANVLEHGLAEDFDFVFINGVFNNKPYREDETLMPRILRALFPHTRRILAFNVISRFVDFMDTELNYVDPCEVFRFCKETLSPLVTLRHD
jgi:SAM-dependent methyltransferase